MHSEEELAGSYNWDYLLDWGPQYQPLAHVFQVKYKHNLIISQRTIFFQEISSLKDEGGSGAGGEARAPPIITCRWPSSSSPSSGSLPNMSFKKNWLDMKCGQASTPRSTLSPLPRRWWTSSKVTIFPFQPKYFLKDIKMLFLSQFSNLSREQFSSNLNVLI